MAISTPIQPYKKNQSFAALIRTRKTRAPLFKALCEKINIQYMKFLKCPCCGSMVDSKKIEMRSWLSNPFARVSIKCTNCGTNIKTKKWLFIIWWIWVFTGFYFMFSDYESYYLNAIMLGGLVFLLGLFYFGLSHEQE